MADEKDDKGQGNLSGQSTTPPAGSEAGAGAGAGTGAQDLGPFKDGKAAYEAWKEIQRYKTSLEEENKALKDEVGAFQETEGQGAEEDPKTFFDAFARDPKGTIRKAMDPDFEAIRKEVRASRFQSEIERMRVRYPDFESLEGEMDSLAKTGAVNSNNPNAVELLYYMVKGRRGQSAAAGASGNGGGQAPPPVVTGGASAQRGSPVDYSKLSFEELEKLAIKGEPAK